MKKIYLCCASLFLAFSSFSQLKQAQFKGAYLPDPSVTHDIAPRGGTVIWEEDFAGGIPADWMVSTVNGPVNWKHTMVGHTGNFPTAALSSTTSSNGWAIVDSDADNFSGGGAENSRLISSRIDLTGYNNVKLEFQQMFRRWQSDVTTVQISLDSVTWTDYVINTTITQTGTPNPDYVNIDLSALAGNEDSVWIAFWWQGEWDYGWQIDDIAFKEILDNDLLMKNESFGTSVEYYMVPQNQVQPFIFSTDVENIGLFSQTGITLDVTVNDGSSNVYSGSSSSIASLGSFTQDSLGLNSAFTPSALGNYAISFAVNQNETDDAPSNNTKVKNMQVTDTVYALDNNNYIGQWYNLESAANNSNAYVIGGAYDIFTTDIATSISVFIGNNSEVGATYVLRLYEFNGTDWTQFQETDIATLDAGDIGNWVTLNLLSSVTLTSGSTYMAALEHFGGPDYIYVGYSSNTNRGYTLSSDDGITFNGQPRNAMIRLNFGQPLGIEEESILATSVYPNPATDRLMIQLNDLNNVNAELIDVTGKVVLTSVLNNNAELNVADIARGIYTLRLSHESSVQTLQVVLTK